MGIATETCSFALDSHACSFVHAQLGAVKIPNRRAGRSQAAEGRGFKIPFAVSHIGRKWLRWMDEGLSLFKVQQARGQDDPPPLTPMDLAFWRTSFIPVAGISF